MKTCISVLMVLVMVSAAQAATGSYTDDFEDYTTTATTANNGSLWFTAANEPMYTPNGWNLTGYWQNGVNYDPVQMIAPGGPHGFNPSGYGDSIGLTNFDGPSPPHGAVHGLPAVPNMAAGDTVELSIKVNLTGVQEDNKVSYISVGNNSMADGLGTDLRSGISFKRDGTGNNFGWQMGPEPPITPVPELALGWTELKVVMSHEYHGGYEAIVTQMKAYARPIAGAWSQIGSYANPTLWTPENISLQPTQYATYDDLSVTVVPEPVTMIILALGGGLVLRRRRR